MGIEMNAILTNGTEKVTIELVEDRDGSFRWYSGGEDTEVSGRTVSEACDAAVASWRGKVEFEFEISL
jgi:hypothetical protein